MKNTFTARIVPARGLLPVAALWTFLGRVGFVNSINSDPGELGFVLNHPVKLAVGPLVQPLVHLAAVVNPITDAANITDSDRRDTSLKEHLHDLPTQFVKKVRDLVVDVVKLLVLRLNQLRPAARAALFTIDLRIELGFQAILVVTESAKFTAVDRECVLTREDSSEVFLSEIDSGDLVSGRSVDRLCVILSTDDKTTRALPDLDGSGFFVDGPINQNRVLSAFRGQTENAIVTERDALIGPPEHVVLFVTTFWWVAPAVVVMPGAHRFVELLRDFLGGLRGQYVMPFAVPSPHRRLTEPVVLPVDRSPVPLADLVPQIRRRPGQPLKLIGALNVEFAGQIHTAKQKPSQLPAGGTGCKATRLPETRGHQYSQRLACGVPRPPSKPLCVRQKRRKSSGREYSF